MITGIRKDPWAERNRVRVEASKEHHYYLHPELYDQPSEKSLLWVHYPERKDILKRSRAQNQIAKQFTVNNPSA